MLDGILYQVYVYIYIYIRCITYIYTIDICEWESKYEEIVSRKSRERKKEKKKKVIFPCGASAAAR